MARTPAALRGQILESALRLFAQYGFRGTSLQHIASDAGCSKASLLYHFANKEAILAELLVPVEREAVALDARLAGLDGEVAAVTAVNAFAALTVRFRREMKVLLDTLPERTVLNDPALDGLGDRIADAMAGRSPDPADQVAAWMALGGMFVTGAADPPMGDEALREAMTAAALRTLGRAAPRERAKGEDEAKRGDGVAREEGDA
ncbi:TetR/AcrR family transcriptional regulator [Actinomadura violacea]|uniref:TetR/AcrR family transcriptional regulator n=1 Tax=Actinomadura violacea TaxID=2819934 RepID=A0ABS3RNS2_9ACTN|nr:TetR/AcrR family transcriptional regulator [Actinomadura violacea]MBO2458405.1 TetR/AcrR family transcriptional regulator [Actinomadura violacea]